jgi:ABC-2 type transport system permease protein
MRRFQYGESMLLWITSIGFLNLAVVGLILSTFTTRFIFPMISLEGRRFWILGSLPVAREEILWSKFLFAVAVSLVPCATLILISDVVLGILQRTPGIAVLHQVICGVLCTGLSALAVGLGARMPNLRETSPAKIAAGFGGTLNLIVSAVYIVVVTVATAVPCCCWVIRDRWPMSGSHGLLRLLTRAQLGSPQAVAIGVCVTLGLGAVVTWTSLRIGFRAFQHLEF